MSKEIVFATLAGVNDIKSDLSELGNALGISEKHRSQVVTNGSYVRVTAFSGLSLQSGMNYKFMLSPVSVSTTNFYLYFVDSSGNEMAINEKTDGNIVYAYTPTEDMENVSIKVSSGASAAQSFVCEWYIDLGDNNIQKLQNSADELASDVATLGESLLSNNDKIAIETSYSGYYVSSYTGAEGNILADTTSFATGYIYVRSGRSVKITGCYLVNNRSICAYDADKKYISTLATHSAATEIMVTVPEEATYVRITGKVGVDIEIAYACIEITDEETQATFEEPAITNEYMITSYASLEGLTAKDANSAVTDYIRVIPNAVINVADCYLTSYRSICAYDKNKTCIKVLETGSKATNVAFVVPNNARFIRITSKKDTVPTIKYLTHIIEEGNVSPQHLKNASLFDTATLKPVLSFIDDDTWGSQYVSRMKNLCDENNVKISFACLTSRLKAEDGLSELLLSYEREGFPIITHGYSQENFYRPETANRDIVKCEDDLVHGLQDMRSYGFTDYKIWCTPFGVYDDDMQKLAIKWGFEGIITSGMIRGIENPYQSSPNRRFAIRRNSLNSADDVEMIKGAIDDAIACDGWVLVSTHSAQAAYSSGENDEAFAEIINYATDNGVEIRTVNEELRRRMPIYRYYEKF